MPRDAVAWAREAESRGAGEILLTSIDRDGTKRGFDCELTAAVSTAVGIPVIASGGAGAPEHFAEVFRTGRADAALAASIFHFGEHPVKLLKQFLLARGIPVRIVAPTFRSSVRRSQVIPCSSLPSILSRPRRAARARRTSGARSDDLDGWIDRFSSFPLVQLVDLDAAMGQGDNLALVRHVCGRLRCQVGGGARSIDRARILLDAGAVRVVVGSALFTDTGVNAERAAEFCNALGRDALVGAVDSRGGQVVIRGWKSAVPISAVAAVRALEPHVGRFLYTHVDTEGTLRGLDLNAVLAVQAATTRPVIAAGGIRSQEEIDALHAHGIDSVVGMAIYRGLISTDRP